MHGFTELVLNFGVGMVSLGVCGFGSVVHAVDNDITRQHIRSFFAMPAETLG